MNLNGVDNKLLKDADDYVRQHRLIELFEDLATAIAYRQPEHLEDFIIERLQLHKTQGLRSGIFTESEVQNVFNLFDLKKEGFISKERAIKAIQTMANSSFQFSFNETQEIPDKVDALAFNKLCLKALGFSKTEF